MDELGELIEIEIDKAKEGLSIVKKMLQNSSFAKDWNLKNEHDFALGNALGCIQGGFILHCSQFPPTSNEERELISILKQKIKGLEDFYNAI